jgi:NIMA-interacting peptidyl-prolyl cis-trans isomerase 1
MGLHFSMSFYFLGKPYYLNVYTKESQWDMPTKPAERDTGKVQCSHLLVKHRGSRRPANWRGDTITRSKEEAIELLKGMAASKHS